MTEDPGQVPQEQASPSTSPLINSRSILALPLPLRRSFKPSSPQFLHLENMTHLNGSKLTMRTCVQVSCNWKETVT